MDLEFAKTVMSIPSCTHHEEFIVKCIKNWCGENGIKTSQDGAGNLYLTKGGGQWKPCFCAHLDTVQDKQAEYADKEQPLDVIVDGDKMRVEGMGIGADDRCGIAVALACMKQLPSCKAAFFSSEEIGCKGSEKLDKEFFKDVSYCIGLDSPGYNRSAKTSMGVPLFTDEFFKEYVEPVFKKHGVTDFRDEPGCDAMFVVKLTGTCCVNTGSGGYDEHRPTEYCKFSEMNKCEALCLDFVKTVPCDKKYEIEYKEPERPRWAPPPFFGGASRERVGGWRGGWGSEWRGGWRQPSLFDPEPVRPPKPDGRLRRLPDDAECSVSFLFSHDSSMMKFMEGPVGDLDVDLDEDSVISQVTISGKLRDVKQAWVLAFNAEESTRYKNWSHFRDNEDDDDFWMNLETADGGGDDDIIDVPDEDVEVKDAEPTHRSSDEALDDFLEWFNNR